MSAAKPLTVDLSQNKEEAALKQALPKLPILTSKDAEWNGIYLACDNYQLPGETPEVVGYQHSILIFSEVPQPIQAERKLDGCFRREKVAQGDVVVIPAHITHQVQWHDPGEVIILGFEVNVFAHAFYEMIDPDQAAIAPHFAQSDPLIYQLGLKLKAELESNCKGSRLYAEAVANLLAIHLLQHYSHQSPKLKNYTGGLPKSKLQQVLDYIDAHLDQSLSLNELASVVQMSPGYFSRMFKQATGFAPHQYLIRYRIKRALQLLRRSKLTIAEVAHQVGFANQGHLNYHFKNLVGVTPKAMQLEK